MTDLQLADIGVNLTDKRFHQDREAVLERAAQAGIRWQLLTGTSVANSRQALELANQYPQLFATAGIHPHEARHFSVSALNDLREMANSAQVRAIGETGLDFNRDFSPRPDQEKAFASQLELACQLGLPVFLHQRDAHPRFLPILREYRDQLVDAVVHCFTGSRAELFDYLDLDCHIGITGWLCDERRGGELRGIVANIPANRLLAETDSPYLIPRNAKQQAAIKGRNEPALLPWVINALAECRAESADQVARASYANSCRVFRVEDFPAIAQVDSPTKA